MKRFSVILPLLFIIIPFLGTFSLFQYQKHLVRKEIKWLMIRGIDKQELILVKVGIDEVETRLRWEHSREFEYAGQMYDVVEREINIDTVFLYCWPDHAETRLNKQLTTLMALAMGQRPHNKDNQKRLADFFKSLFRSPQSEKTTQVQVIEMEPVHSIYRSDYSSFNLPPPSPPPEIG